MEASEGGTVLARREVLIGQINPRQVDGQGALKLAQQAVVKFTPEDFQPRRGIRKIRKQDIELAARRHQEVCQWKVEGSQDAQACGIAEQLHKKGASTQPLGHTSGADVGDSEEIILDSRHVARQQCAARLAVFGDGFIGERAIRRVELVKAGRNRRGHAQVIEE